MAQSRQRSSAVPPQPRPVSADFLNYDYTATSSAAVAAATAAQERSSMLYSILPSAVQSRLPRIPSLRRSVSMYGLSASKSNRHRATRSGPNTPPGSSYGSAMVLREGNEMVDYFTETMESEDDSAPARQSRAAPPAQQQQQQQTIELTENKSGISWKFAGQGLNLIGLAVDESSTLSRNDEYGNATFARQLFIHALTYLLRGLPEDLTTDEQLSIRSALPPSVVSSMRIELTGQQLLDSSAMESKNSSRALGRPQQPSVLHRALASTIVQAFILMQFVFQFILPYLRVLLRAAYQYERTHRIGEKVLASSIDTVDSMSKRGLSVGGTVWGSGLGEVVGWVVDGVTGGIQDGVGEGMVVIGARRGLDEDVNLRRR